jgi:GGDEF domain-containing protein
MPAHELERAVTQRESRNKFDALDEYMRQADEAALTALHSRLHLEERLEQLLQNAEHLPKPPREADDTDD